MSLWNIDWKEVTIWWLVCILVFGVGYAAGAYDSKHAADRWWQADEAKKIQTVWGIAGQSIWDNAAQCSTGCSGIVPNDGTFCGDNSGCYTMKDGLCVSGDCFGKPTIPSGENLWQDGQETPAPGGGKYSRLPYPVCMEDTGIGYGLVPIPCPKEKPKQ